MRHRGMLAWRYIGFFDLFPLVDRLQLTHQSYHRGDLRAMATSVAYIYLAAASGAEDRRLELNPLSVVPGYSRAS
jgi:hypothetical protein